jgi:thymidylate synthase
MIRLCFLALPIAMTRFRALVMMIAQQIGSLGRFDAKPARFVWLLFLLPII